MQKGFLTAPPSIHTATLPEPGGRPTVHGRISRLADLVDTVAWATTCLEEVDYSDRNAETSEKPLFSMREEETPEVNPDPRARQKEYLDSKRRVVAERLCYARPTRSSWPLKQGGWPEPCCPWLPRPRPARL